MSKFLVEPQGSRIEVIRQLFPYTDIDDEQVPWVEPRSIVMSGECYVEDRDCGKDANGKADVLHSRVEACDVVGQGFRLRHGNPRVRLKEKGVKADETSVDAAHKGDAGGVLERLDVPEHGQGEEDGEGDDAQHEPSAIGLAVEDSPFGIDFKNTSVFSDQKIPRENNKRNHRTHGVADDA